MLYIKNFSQDNKNSPEKEYWGNNYIDESLSGLVIGGGIAGLGNLLMGDKKKSRMRRFLEGAGMGAVVGAGAGLAYSGLKHKDEQIKSLKKDVKAGDESYVNAVADRNAAQYERDSAVKDRESVGNLLSGATQKISGLEKSLGSAEDGILRLRGDNEELRARLGYSNDELIAARGRINDLESKAKADSELVKRASSMNSRYENLMKNLRPRFAAGEDVFNINPLGKYGFIREYDPEHYSSLSQRIQHWDEEDRDYAKLEEHARKSMIPGMNGYILRSPNYGQGYDRSRVQEERKRFAHINSVLEQMESMGIPRDEAFDLLNQHQMARSTHTN